MFTRTVLLLLLLWGQDTVWSVRLTEVRVPAQAKEGGTALLSCHWDMEGDELYSVKWYKDNHEFFRYVPRSSRAVKTAFSPPGVHVNVEKSSSTLVVLENLSRESEGYYMCEVSGEAPEFANAKIVMHINIQLIPESGPFVNGLKEQYYFDDQAVINCTSGPSRPPVQLSWLVNGQPAEEEDLRGPWNITAPDRYDASITVMQLRFTVAPRHFVNGAMRLRCLATLSPFYMSETNSTHYIDLFPKDQSSSNYDASAGFSSSSETESSIAVILLPSITPLILFHIARLLLS